MRGRAALAVASAMLGAAVLGHVLERRTNLSCDCTSACWCRQPGLALFRWVIPIGHRCEVDNA